MNTTLNNTKQSITMNVKETDQHYEKGTFTGSGHIYQLKILMLFVIRAMNKGYHFRLATEWENADKFDDLVFEYVDNHGQQKFRFLQAKHRQDKSKKITAEDLLLSNKKGDFNLQKYFISYLKINIDRAFQNGVVEDLIICTNIGFDLEDSSLTQLRKCGKNKEKTISVEIVDSVDDFFQQSDGGVRYNLQKNSDLTKHLKQCDEAIKIIQEQGIQNIDIEINKFLDKLLFAVKQPREDELSKIIGREIGERFKLLDSDLATNDVLVDMLDWMKTYGKKVEFLTHRDAETFFKSTEQKLNKLKISGWTSVYSKRLKGYDIEFQSNALTEITKFLDHNQIQKQILNIKSQFNTGLSAIKVNQAIRDHPSYQEKDSYIFLSLDDLVRLQNDVLLVFEAQNSGNLLIIECESETSDISNIFNQLSQIICRNDNKKVILISQGKNVLAEKFEYNFSKTVIYGKQNDQNTSLIDLTIKEQVKFLEEKKVIFQGKEVGLGVLINDSSKHLIDGEILYKLINNEKVEIGKALDNLGDINWYYIDRVFTRKVRVKDTLLKDLETPDLFVVSNIEQNDLYKLVKKEQKVFKLTDNDPDTTKPINFIVLDNESAEMNFQQLSRDYSSRNIHWFKKEVDEFVWQKSYGDSLSDLRGFLSNQNNNNIEIEESGFIKQLISNDDDDDKIVIISAEPGMGKSTILSHLAVNANETDSSLWIVKINLADFACELSNINPELNVVAAIKFLYRTVGFQLFQKKNGGEEKEREEFIQRVARFIIVQNNRISLVDYEKEFNDLSLLEIKLFNHFYNNGKIVILFDGFDEISPDYKKEVINLLGTLKNTKVSRICITTRPYGVLYELEDKFSTFSFSLKPLLKEDQGRLLRKFWKASLNLNELNEQRSAVFIEELLHRFVESTMDEERKFLGIPLQIRMLAEIIQDIFKEFYYFNDLKLSDEHERKLNEQLNLVTLYEKFIKKKFYKIRFGEKQRDVNTDNLSIKRMIEREYKEFLENHRKLSVYVMFKEKKMLSKQEIKTIHEFIETIRIRGEETGLVNLDIHNKPSFIHQTFAEYFSADYFWEKFKSIKLNEFKNKFIKDIIENIFSGNKLLICRFFYLTASRDLERDTDFPKNIIKIATLLESIVDPINMVYKICERFHKDQLKYIDNLYFRRDFVADKYALGEERDFLMKKGPDYSQSIALLFNVVEYFLLGSKARDFIAIKDVITRTVSLSLLRISAELGCINFAKMFINAIEFNYRKELNESIWTISPLWLAAKNGRLDVVELLKKCYNPDWVDRNGNNLIQRIFNRKEFEVLNSCLILNILDGKPFKNSLGDEQLPLDRALQYHAPSHVIKLLAEKTNIGLINTFLMYGDMSNSFYAINEFIGILTHEEIIETLMKKSFNFPKAIHALLFRIAEMNLQISTEEVQFGHNLEIFFDSIERCLNIFNIIKMLLKYGVGYNYQDIEHTTVQYAKQIYYIYEFLNDVHTLHNQRNVNNNKPTDTILKLIIDNEHCEIIRLKDIFVISFNYNHKSISASSPSKAISLLPYHMVKLFFKVHKYRDTDLVDRTLNVLRNCVRIVKEEYELICSYGDNKCDLMCEYVFKYRTWVFNNREEEIEFEYLGKFAADLLHQLLMLHIHQGYEINDALEEISENVSKFKEVLNQLLTQKNNSRCTKHEISSGNSSILNKDILSLKNIETNEKLQYLISKIYESGNIILLCKVWSNLNSYVGQKKVMETLELMLKLSSQPPQIFELLNKLDKSYNQLTNAIRNRNYQEINNVLQNVFDVNFVKAIINSQDNIYGSPLHYAAYIGDIKITEILLINGANPNLTLNEFMKLTITTIDSVTKNEEEKIEVEEGGLPKNDQDGTPLHVAVQEGHVNIIKLLLKYGGNPVIKNYFGETPIQSAEKRISLNPLICREIIDILKNKHLSQQKEDRSINPVDEV